ncbi:hypothetical protein [Streptacidiphilus cavernicola]|uniref:Uncharacterized protein n=1 Tax=Streptacidiphilus cavernicola TaxID=3342716 RepID=A0ABV6VYN0_9ACTN
MTPSNILPPESPEHQGTPYHAILTLHWALATGGTATRTYTCIWNLRKPGATREEAFKQIFEDAVTKLGLPASQYPSVLFFALEPMAMPDPATALG